MKMRNLLLCLILPLTLCSLLNGCAGIGHAVVPGYTTYSLTHSEMLDLQIQETERRLSEAVTLMGENGGAQVRVSVGDLPGWWDALGQRFSEEPVEATGSLIWDLLKGYGIYRGGVYLEEKINADDDEDGAPAQKGYTRQPGYSDLTLTGNDNTVTVFNKPTDHVDIIGNGNTVTLENPE